jgi:uncharacterized membrane protein
MSPRSLRIALILSVLVNVFLLASIVGGVAWLHAQHPLIGAGSLRIAGAELPPPERRAFRAALREARWRMRPVALAARQARLDASQQLRAPVVDEAALSEALARARDADIAIRQELEGRAIAFVATLPQADRTKLADGLLRRPGAQRPRECASRDGLETLARSSPVDANSHGLRSCP